MNAHRENFSHLFEVPLLDTQPRCWDSGQFADSGTQLSHHFVSELLLLKRRGLAQSYVLRVAE